MNPGVTPPLAGLPPADQICLVVRDLDVGREGVQHIRFVVDELEAWIARAAAVGYRPVWSGSYPASLAAPPLGWCYLARDGDPLMIEFVQFG